MWKKIVFGVVAAAVLGAGIYFYLHLREIKTPVSDAIDAIPSDAALIFESRQSRGTWKKLSGANIMWSDLIGTEFISKLDRDGRIIDSLIALDPEVSELLESRPVLISMHKTGANDLDFLYAYSLPDITKRSLLEDFIRSTNKGAEPARREHEGVTIFTINVKPKKELSYTFAKGILIASFNPRLVEKAIQHLNSGVSLQEDKHFSSVLKGSGEKVDGNIYINYKTLPDFFSRFVSPTHKGLVSSISRFAAWTEVDATIRPNEALLSGFTASNDSLNNYLGIFRKQKSQDIAFTSIIPANTSSFVFFGISNFKTFRADQLSYFKSQGKSKEIEDTIASVNAKYNVDVESSLLSWIGNEMAMVITEPVSADISDRSFAVFHSNDIEEAKQLVNSLCDSVSKIMENKPDTESFQGYSIRQLPLTGIIPKILGSPFEHVQQNYYAAIGNYMVFGNSAMALHQIINSYEGEKTLEADQYYGSFAGNNLSGDASLYVYSNIARSPNLYKAYASEEHSKDIDEFLEIYRRFQAIGIQFISNGELFYSNIFIKHNPIYKQETNSLWEVPLDTTVSSKPWLVTNHNTKSKEIFVQDDANKIYLISSTGKILWSRQLPEKIMSDVVQVDGLKNGKLQVLFNTRSHIYIIDRNGKDVKDYPIALKSPATNGITVIDYEKNLDYRLLIACENKRLLNLKMNGQLVDGWKFDKTKYPVTMPVQHHNIGGKDHLIAVDSNGKVYVLDRHGSERVKVKEHINKPLRTFYVEQGKDIGRSAIIACDTIGNVIRLSIGGDMETMKLGDFHSAPSFDYKDLDNDKMREYIFLDEKELAVYKQDKSLVFHHEFAGDVNKSRSLFFLFPDDMGYIGVASPAANEIYLFDNSGQLHPGFPLTGSTLFCIGNINNDDALYLITASGKTVYAYTLE
jgi:hypothetical protein